MNFLEVYWTDVYKVGHKPMLPVGSTLMYSNNTPRSGKYSNCPNEGKIVVFSQQKLSRQLVWDWDANFFKRPIEEIDQFGADITAMLGLAIPYDTTHIKDLHKLGYLPIRIKALKEGSLVPYKIPSFTIVNTKPLNGVIVDWLVNYLETILSAESWQAPTSATFSYFLRKLGEKWILKTDKENIGFLDYQFHDFSMRGMGGKSAIINSGLGFATSSKGSDTLPVIPAARMYYDEKEPCISSVIASEHAIMCSLTGFFMQNAKGDWTKVGEFEYEMFVYLLKKFPSGVLSLVMDTFDLWRAITKYCVKAKDIILARDGKLVIRPDSGDPVDILCGWEIPSFDTLDDAKDYFEGQLENNTVHGEPEFTIDSEMIVKVNDKFYELTEKTNWDRHDKQYYYIDSITINSKELKSEPKYIGVIELLWNVFGGTTNDQGYRVLDSHIGAIYGDSINYVRAENIFTRLEAKKFASTNVVLGIGSYSLQYVTRDTHGSAQKATYIEIGDQGIEIFKDPITDDGIKKSAKGLLMVYKNKSGEYILKDQCTWEEEAGGLLQTILEDGKFYNQTTLTEIREYLKVQ